MTVIKSNQDPSYITAIVADEACYTNSQDLLSANGRSQPKQFRGRLDEHRQNIKMLSGEDIEFELNGVVEHDKSRYFKSIIGNDLKICLDCVNESSCPIQHSYIYSTHCSKHDTKLISYCSCGHKFSWDHALINGQCSSCAETLMPTHEPVSAHQTFIESANVGERSDIIWDLCCAASYILRPIDSSPELIHYDKVPADISLFERAYSLLTDETAFSKWSHELAFNRHKFSETLGTYAVFAPIEEFKKKLKGNWPVLDFYLPTNPEKPSSSECFEFGVEYFPFRPKWKRHGLTDSEQNQLARDKANLTTIADVIGLDVNQTSEFMNNIDVKPLNGHKKNGNLFYNLDELKDCFSNCQHSAPEGDLLLARTLDEQLSSFMTDRSDILGWFYHKELNGFLIRNDRPIYERLKVSPISALKHMFKHLNQRGKSKISYDEALEVFQLTDADIKELNKNGKLYSLKWQQSLKSYYLVEDFLKIDKQNFNFRRYCSLRNLDFEFEVNKLKKLKIEALYGTSIYQCRYQVLYALRYNELTLARKKSEKPKTPPSNPLWFTLGIKPLR
ncbi:hypothetical protein PALB_29350 [Pseudoalteromonas luteoviolacea B = ATCC 29581]|nr:hypothetical protein PALB_29350 [Pseudoalteromonas luteoviolacea B = ATCC 29581]